jgi:hypothetical protein
MRPLNFHKYFAYNLQLQKSFQGLSF